MKKSILSLIILSLFSTISNSETVFCVNCSNEVMDMMRQAQNFAQFTAQTSNMINQLEVLRRQAATLSSSTPDSISNAVLSQVIAIARESNVLGTNLQNFERDFQKIYPGSGQGDGNYFDKYKNWTDNTSNTIKAALKTAGLQIDNFSNEANTAETLRLMTQRAGGAMQALQIGNAVSSELLDEMRKLRAIQVSQSQAQNAYLLGTQNQSDQKEYGLKNFLNQKNSVVQPYTSSKKTH